MNAAHVQSADSQRQLLETRYRRFAGIGLAFLSARCSAAQVAAIHRDIWLQIRAARSKRLSASTLREFLIAQAAARCGEIEPHRFDEPTESLRQALTDSDPPVAQLVRLRLANYGYSELAQLWNTKAEHLSRTFADIRSRWTRSDGRGPWSLGIPNDPSHTAHWLERHLVGARLGMLVAELESVHAESAREPAFLAPLLQGHRRTAVLEAGLAALSARRTAALLTHPRLLLDLQAVVLAYGGPYWDEVRPIDDRIEIMAQRHWPWIRAA